MKPTGDDDLLAIRCALLDALDALRAHRDSVIMIGAQAIYLHTGAAVVDHQPMVIDALDPADDRRSPQTSRAPPHFSWPSCTSSASDKARPTG